MTAKRPTVVALTPVFLQMSKNSHSAFVATCGYGSKWVTQLDNKVGCFMLFLNFRHFNTLVLVLWAKFFTALSASGIFHHGDDMTRWCSMPGRASIGSFQPSIGQRSFHTRCMQWLYYPSCTTAVSAVVIFFWGTHGKICLVHFRFPTVRFFFHGNQAVPFATKDPTQKAPNDPRSSKFRFDARAVQ